jgi:hypothetical protein
MRASVGDRIVIKSRHMGEPDRECEVIEVRGPYGDPPYIVRWEDSGRECFFLPEIDASVKHLDNHGARNGRDLQP